MTQKIHISHSELKTWYECPHKHKLNYIDKIKKFKGNEYTAFGTALHEVCEKQCNDEPVEPFSFFEKQFVKELKSLDSFNEKMAVEMNNQSKAIIPLIMPKLKEQFPKYEVAATEMALYEPIEDNLFFKGYIDLVLKLPDEKYIILDWKTCSWGWDSRKKADKMITYQLTFYKNFFCQATGVDPKNVETYFALLKRTAKKDNVEIFRVTSGPKKTENALKFMNKALYNIKRKNYIKNRLSCKYCEYKKTEYCT
jgi:ATP-dependent exoDNAse (exonuclease V) beta subunit